MMQTIWSEELRFLNSWQNGILWMSIVWATSCATMVKSTVGNDCPWSEPKIAIHASGPSGQRVVYFETWCIEKPQVQSPRVEVDGVIFNAELSQVNGRWILGASMPFVSEGSENPMELPVWNVPLEHKKVQVSIYNSPHIEACQLELPIFFSDAI